ncbi:Uncharacterized anaerobic dehydrogenase [Dermatophilus congolensis]|uniref:Uncharacterized anaerobic dehydrogenase n=1 Tax=Dermatophilus congolensis TaxID=1863 RepID=A0A239V2I6_9MICO|nr:4Fe-4S dicluster domain-containing protein [Dermatophilus congolensis]SNV16447.1 Uncharacterized anaerobic dehydrogenase [Dermatophilus congolensis]
MPTLHTTPQAPAAATTELGAVRQWLQSRSAGIEVVLICAEHPHPHDTAYAVTRARPEAVVIRAPGCLAHVRRSQVVHILADGAAGVRLLIDGCTRPDQVHARMNDLLALMRDTNTTSPETEQKIPGTPLLQVWTSLPPATSRPTPPIPLLEGKSMPVSRRTLVGAPAQSALPHPQASEHNDLITALMNLHETTGQRLPDAAAAAATAAPAVMLAAPGCNACGTCVRTCPEKALDLQVVGEGTAVLTESIGACSGCRHCVQACPSHVLTVRRHARWSDQLRGGVLPVAQQAVTACVRCCAPTPIDAGGLCQVCAYRRKNPFGSTLPAHLTQ